ncbi:MAG: hypothetical protein K8I27_06545 [Planctomycetes bacterium]|nr:hypothetical protein [Planctomycetota bacterium]
MSNDLRGYLPWVGVWTGIGEAQAGMSTLVRTEVFYAAAGQGIGFHFEAFDTEARNLYHGVRAVVVPAPSGVVRAVAWSSIHGPLILEQTPDDEGVLALAGESRAGNHISVTFVEEGPDELLFAAFWRPQHGGAKPDAPSMSIPLRRVTPLQVPMPGS